MILVSNNLEPRHNTYAIVFVIERCIFLCHFWPFYGTYKKRRNSWRTSKNMMYVYSMSYNIGSFFFNLMIFVHFFNGDFYMIRFLLFFLMIFARFCVLINLDIHIK